MSSVALSIDKFGFRVWGFGCLNGSLGVFFLLCGVVFVFVS